MDDWPVTMKDQLILGDPDSGIAICSLWTPREHTRLRWGYHFNCIGNLYSRDGINYILENLLANPRIRTLIVTGRCQSELAGVNVSSDSKSALSELWGSRRMDSLPTFLDPRFSDDDVRSVLEDVTICFSNNVSTITQEQVYSLDPGPPPRKAKYFPPREIPHQDQMPGEDMGYLVRGPNMLETWYGLLDLIMRNGRVTGTSFGSRQREIVGLTSVIGTEGGQYPDIPEWAPFDIPGLQAYINKFTSSVEDPDVSYQYGPRLLSTLGGNQVELMVSKLKSKPESRSAYASLWVPYDDAFVDDPPCLTSIQGMIRDESLHLFATIRSNDMFRAWPYNASGLASLQNMIAQELDVEPGPLGILSTSAHIYEENWEEARYRSNEEMLRIQTRFDVDPRGNIVLRWEGTGVADIYSPDGDIIRQIEAASPRALRLRLNGYISRVDHALYIGEEVAKLFSQREGYIQDKV